MSTMLRKVLLLSSSYQPIAFCSMRKALNLIFLEKAEIIEPREDAVLRGVFRTFDCPSIIRLKNTYRGLVTKVQLNRKNVMKRDGFRCMYCGNTSDLTIDHIVPKSRGGKTSWDNLVTACNGCNNKKDNKFLHESGMKLRTIPKTPNRIIFLRQEVKTIEENWKPYLYLT